MGNKLSFFKKNKSKKTDKPVKPSPAAIEKEILQMDRDINLDQQIEELTSQLNISPENDLEIQTENTPSDSTPLKLGAIGSINQELNNYKAPSLEANPVKEDETLLLSESTSLPSALDDSPEIASFELDSESLNPTRLNMADMRMDVARISADIQGGEELYRRALQRVEGLMGQVEKAEVDFSVLNRLEPENRRLKARLRTAQGELEGNKDKLSLIRADLEDHQERLDEKTVQYEQSRVKLVSATKTLREYDRVLKQTKSDVERHTLALELSLIHI